MIVPKIKVSIRKHFIGYYAEGVITIRIYGERNKIRDPKAICIEQESIKKIESLGIPNIVIYDSKHKMTYMTSFKNFMEHSKLINHGFGKQYAMELKHWKYTKNERLDFDEIRTE